jgi:hypothetical protein
MSKALASRFTCNFSVRQLGLVEERCGTAQSIRHGKRATMDRQAETSLWLHGCLPAWSDTWITSLPYNKRMPYWFTKHSLSVEFITPQRGLLESNPSRKIVIPNIHIIQWRVHQVVGSVSIPDQVLSCLWTGGQYLLPVSQSNT